MQLLSKLRSGARRLLRLNAKEAVEAAPFGSVPDPGLGGFGAGNLFRQWIGIYQLVDRLARARGGNIGERPADERMLYIARGLMRYNGYAQGMIGALRNHTLGSRGLKHTPTGPSRKPLGAWLERWKEHVDWWQWEREIYERVHIEGESVMRFFPNEETVELRPIEPEWILPKDGTLQWTFGFYNEKDDVHDITALCEQQSGAGEVIDAAEWYHIKSKLSVRADKRGRSDFLASAQLLDDSFKTWRNFLQSEAVRQSVIYFAKQAPGVTSADLDQAIAAEADYGPPMGSTGRKLGEAMAMQYGAAVEYIQDGTEVLAVPASNAQGTMTGVNAGLLAAGRAYHIPLVLMSGDMSANNTIDFSDESPFGATIQDEQNWYSRHVRNIMWRAVEYAVNEGQLPQSVLYDGTNIEVAAERSKSRNSLDNTQRAKTLYDDGVISARERATMEGVDYDEQQAQRAREGAGQGLKADVAEDVQRITRRYRNRLAAEGFTGIDSHGHHWQNGKQIKASKTADDKKASTPKSSEQPTVDGVTAVWSAFQKASGSAKEYLAAALHNGGVYDPEDLKRLPKDVDPYLIAEQVAANYDMALRRGKSEAAAAFEGVMPALGLVVHGKPGAQVKFDGSLYRSESPMFTGDAAKVVRPAVVGKTKNGGNITHIKGVVEPA